MKGKKGFTLIELLVVIAIIALLLSIMTPALRRAREVALTVICQSRLKQWHPVAELFAMDNNGMLPDAELPENPALGAAGHWWIQAFRPYYQDPTIRLCPKASQVPSFLLEGGDRAPTEAWATTNPFPELEPSVMVNNQRAILGSIGFNGWMMDPSEGVWVPSSEREYWKRLVEVRQPWTVPLFMDSYWVDSWPRHTDAPQPVHDDRQTWDIYTNQIQRFNIDRHNGYVNGVFVDGSVRKIGLKGLWGVKWHREFNTGNQWTRDDADWPDWMRQMPF